MKVAIARLPITLALVCAVPACAQTPTAAAVTRVAPGRYTVVRDGITAELRLLPAEHGLLFHAVGPQGEPPVEQQAALLRLLLPALLAEARPPVLGFTAQPHAALVDQAARAAARDRRWNGGRGGPGLLRRNLLHALDEAARPFADAFAVAGYRLQAVTASRITTGMRPGLPGRVPTAIGEIGFEARALAPSTRTQP